MFSNRRQIYFLFIHNFLGCIQLYESLHYTLSLVAITKIILLIYVYTKIAVYLQVGLNFIFLTMNQTITYF